MSASRPTAASKTWSWSSTLPMGRLLLVLVTAGAYIIGSIPAQILLRETSLSAVFFIPAGISAAFLLRTPKRHWWAVLAGVALGESVMDWWAGYPPFAIGWFVAANVVEPLIGAWIVWRWCGPIDLARLKDFLWFLVGPVLVGCAAGAAIGSTAVHLLGDANFNDVFLQWWVGDALGVILIGSAILALASGPDRRSILSPLGILLVLASAVTVVLTIRSELPITFLVLIGVVIAGAIFGTRAVTVVALTVAFTYTAEIAFGSGILIPGISDATALLIIKMRLGVYTLAGLMVAAEANELFHATSNAVRAQETAKAVRWQSQLEHEVATRLQQSMLPARLPDHSDLSLAVRYLPGQSGMMVGGDWYDVLELENGKLGLCVGDVSGSGLEAATTMGRLRTAVLAWASTGMSPRQVLNRLDRFMADQSDASLATAVYATIDPSTRTMRYASSGHPPMLLVGDSTEWLNEAQAPPLGTGMAEPALESSLTLDFGDLLVLYTDGLVERRGESILDGLARLERRAAELAGLSAEEICDGLLEISAASGHDDVVVLVVKFNPDREAVPLQEVPMGSDTHKQQGLWVSLRSDVRTEHL